MARKTKPPPRRPKVPARRRRPALARRTDAFGESVIREMSRFGAEVGGINLAQGLPDFEPPPEVLAALTRAIARPEDHQVLHVGSGTFGRRGPEYAMERLRPTPRPSATRAASRSRGLRSRAKRPGDEAIVFEPGTRTPAGVLLAGRATASFRAGADTTSTRAMEKAVTGDAALLVNTTGNPSGRLTREDS